MSDRDEGPDGPRVDALVEAATGDGHDMPSGGDALELELAAAALHLALADPPDEPLPAALADRVRAGARGFFAGREAGRGRRPRLALGPALGLALAAGALASVVTWTLARGPSSPPAAGGPPPLEPRDELLRAGGAERLAWAPPTDPAFARTRGDVVWCDARQGGYLLLEGCPPNDPSLEHYQLWIVDPVRDARPVDGGVFDVDATGRAVVPFWARLPVRSPAAFALTLEKRGGVVVSDGPLLCVARR